MCIARAIQSNMAEAGSLLQQKKIEKVVLSTVPDVKVRKKSYQHELVSSIVKMGAKIVRQPALNSRISSL